MGTSDMEAADCKRHGYVLTDRTLGSGSYAKVKLAQVMDRKISRSSRLRDDITAKGHKMVAIKIISKRDAPVEYLNKFMPREIDAMRITYKHTNLIQLYEFFRSEHAVYLVLEYAANGDILSYINDSVLETGMAVDENKARQLFRQIVAGVSFCHGRNVVHRDLKCENVLLDESWNVKISDFGFACRFPSNRCNMLTTFCGSYAYAAPEILEAKNYDGKLADVWSLGVILYAMVNGRLPFNDQNLRTLMDQTKKKIKFQSWVSKDCIHLIKRLLRQRPLLRMRVDEIVQHPWMRTEPICNAWHEGAAAMYERDPNFRKKGSFTRFMTMTESISSKQRQDRRAIIKESQQSTAMTSLTPSTVIETTTTTAATTPAMTPTPMTPTPNRPRRESRSASTKTPVLLADGRIVKRELNLPSGRPSEESRQTDSRATKYAYGPDHNKYYGANLFTLKKKIAASEEASTSPQYASNMRSRMRNLYRRILADNPAGEKLFKMDDADETGRCLVSKNCEAKSTGKNDKTEVGDESVNGAVGMHRVRPPMSAGHDVSSRHDPDGDFPHMAPRYNAFSTTATDNSSSPISAVAVANGSSPPPQAAASNKGDQPRADSCRIPQITAPATRDILLKAGTLGKDFRLSPTNPSTGEDTAVNTAAKAKMLSRRDKVQTSRIKSSKGRCRTQETGGILASDLFSQLQNLPLLRKIKS